MFTYVKNNYNLIGLFGLFVLVTGCEGDSRNGTGEYYAGNKNGVYDGEHVRNINCKVVRVCEEVNGEIYCEDRLVCDDDLGDK